MPTTDTDRGAKKIQAVINQLANQGAYIKAGIMGSGSARKQTTQRLAKDATVTSPSKGLPGGNVQLGTIHEYGLEKIDKNGRLMRFPERSFIRKGIANNLAALYRLEEQVLGKVLRGGATLDQALGILALKMKSVIQARFGAVLTAETGMPLIDTGQLKNSITYEVHIGGAK